MAQSWSDRGRSDQPINPAYAVFSEQLISRLQPGK